MNSNSRFSNGFLLGLIVGGGAVFLLGTKTGKKILKNLSEQGWEGVTEMLEEAGLDEYIEDEPVREESLSNHQHADEEIVEKEIKEEPKEPVKKRFFRKTKN